jgi:energy-converting hydrogenase A subunit R
MRDFAADNLVCIPGIKDTLQHIRGLAPGFIVSASYEHYLRALCQVLEFPFENTYCTRVSLDGYWLPEEERGELKGIAEGIARMPVFEVTPDMKSLDDLPREDQKVIRELDELFWERIAKMEIGRIYSEVNPVGGGEKAWAVRDIARKQRVPLRDVMYVGDSITDDEAFKLVKGNGGLTVSFNGNEYAVENSEIAILSEHSIVTAIVADVFLRFGKPDVLELVENWDRRALERSSVERSLLNRLFKAYRGRLPKVKIISDQNMETLGKESSRFRNKVRGEAIGRLG